jgi:hypothetical protein
VSSPTNREQAMTNLTDLRTTRAKPRYRCCVCKQDGADFEIDWRDEYDQARECRIHAKCEDAFFQPWHRRRPHS